MQKTLFKKYLRITSLIILISFFFLSLVMVAFISGYWQTEKHDLLQKNAESVAVVAAESVQSYQDNEYIIDGRRMQVFISAFASNIDSDIFVTDLQGNRLLTAYGGSGTSTEGNVSQDIINRVLSGSYYGQGTLDGIYTEQHYIVGMPITVTGMETGLKTPIGAVFVASNAHSLMLYRTEIIKVFVLAAFLAFLVSFAVVWLFSYKLARPLRDMAAAARNFGNGDFSTRVPVTSQDEIGQLAIAFNNMASSLATGESARRNFIANVSHELKTPMTTIAGFIDGILDGTIPEEKRKYYLQIVSQEVKRLSRLVKSMLDLSRIDNGELKLRPARFDLSATVVNTLLTFEDAIEKKNITIEGLEDLPSIYADGDPDMIHQVVYNLIENAVKFTNEQGYIAIRIEEGIDKVVVLIKNSGQGIPAEEVPLVFDRFYKTDKSRSKDKTGMGLGLYIVRTIVRLHGGDISVSSVENEYCQFEFWLPKHVDPAAPKLKEPVREALIENKKESRKHD